jgi:RNA binding exosome subunit
MLFHRIQLEAFCHATEDESRVEKAMLSFIPFDIRDKKDLAVSKERIIGTFGNPITILRLELTRSRDTRAVVDFIKGKLGEEGRREISKCMEERLSEDCQFWVRFDKQEAYKGRLVLGGDDTIQLKGKVAAYPANRNVALNLTRGVWSQERAPRAITART